MGSCHVLLNHPISYITLYCQYNILKHPTKINDHLHDKKIIFHFKWDCFFAISKRTFVLNRFMIQPNGTIYTNCPPEKLDREQMSVFYLTLTVEDVGGRRSTAPLEIQLTDVNDNAPRFQQDTYYAFVMENDVSAIDHALLSVLVRYAHICLYRCS